MNRHLIELAAALHRRHRPFVIATVVWSRAPSSGKAGGSALIEPDGTIHGWIGGACAEPAVIREARHAIRDGTPRLMYMGPAEELDGNQREGVIAIPISCASDGALEVFMEPVLPKPHVVVIGRSPAVDTLAHMVAAMDWRATVVDDGGRRGELLAQIEFEESLTDWAAAVTDPPMAVVVATQGHYDEAALEAALNTASPYVGLVASAGRARTVLGYLADRGTPADAIARVVTPAGLDLGHIEHREIGVAILAELVKLRTSITQAGSDKDADSPPPTTAIDPICGMEVDVEGARFTADHDGTTLYFCCPACLQLFSESPEQYLTDPNSVSGVKQAHPGS